MESVSQLRFTQIRHQNSQRMSVTNSSCCPSMRHEQTNPSSKPRTIHNNEQRNIIKLVETKRQGDKNRAARYRMKEWTEKLFWRFALLAPIPTPFPKWRTRHDGLAHERSPSMSPPLKFPTEAWWCSLGWDCSRTFKMKRTPYWLYSRTAFESSMTRECTPQNQTLPSKTATPMSG